MRWLLLILLVALPAGAEDISKLLPGTYQVRYWELGEGRAKKPGTETMAVKAQGAVYDVTWTLAGSPPIKGIGLVQGKTFSVGYTEDGQVGVIVYDIQWDAHTVRLANGHWTSGRATQVGCEDAERKR